MFDEIKEINFKEITYFKSLRMQDTLKKQKRLKRLQKA